MSSKKKQNRCPVCGSGETYTRIAKKEEHEIVCRKCGKVTGD